MRVRKLVIASSLLALAVTAAPAREAHAQSANGGGQPYPAACNASTVPAAESERAHKIYEAGKVQYDDKNYEPAIAAFRDAYKRDCSKHDLLIIISRAYELKGDRVEALRALETYMERVPNSPDASAHRNGIESLKKQIAAQQAAPQPTAATAPPVEMREHTIPPWIVVGAGGIAIIAGIVVVATAPAKPAGCETANETCTRMPGESEEAFMKRQEEAGKAKDQPIYGGIVIGGGAALVVGGLLWHFLEPTGPVEKTAALKPKLTPAVSPGYAGLSLGASF